MALAHAHSASAASPRPAGPDAPAAHGHWSAADWRRHADTRALLRAWDEFRAARPARPQGELVALFAAAPAADLGLESTTPGALGPPSAAAGGVTVAAWAAGRGLAVSPRTLTRYAARLARDGNVDRRGRRSADGAAPLTPAAWELFKSLWLAPQRRTVALCWEVVAIEARRLRWDWPALRTIQERVRAELPPFFADYYRLGAERWARRHAQRIDRDLSSVRANERWVGDHARLDFLALHAGRPLRPWLTAWQDQRSRMIVGWLITCQPDTDTITSAFSAGVLAYGAPLEVTLDNGKDYRAAGFSGGKARRLDETKHRCVSVCAAVGVRARFCLPYEPGSKCIESWFATLHERFDKLYDSYCGRDPQHRPEDLYDRLRAGGVELPTLDRVRADFARYLEAFHGRPHSGDGMDGLSPREAFARCDPIPRRTAPRALLEELLKRTVKVTVTRRGVRHNGVYYGQAEERLWPLRGREVLLALDPGHAEFVDVRDLEGRPVCRAYQQRLRGVDQADIREARRRQKQARKLVRAIGPAYRDAARDVVDLALESQAVHADRLRAAVGAECGGPGVPAERSDSSPGPPRPLALLPAAATLVDLLPDPEAAPAEQADPLDGWPDDAPPPEPPAADPLDALPDLGGDAAPRRADPLDDWPLGDAS